MARRRLRRGGATVQQRSQPTRATRAKAPILYAEPAEGEEDDLIQLESGDESTMSLSDDDRGFEGRGSSNNRRSHPATRSRRAAPRQAAIAQAQNGRLGGDNQYSDEEHTTYGAGSRSNGQPRRATRSRSIIPRQAVTAQKQRGKRSRESDDELDHKPATRPRKVNKPSTMPRQVAVASAELEPVCSEALSKIAAKVPSELWVNIFRFASQILHNEYISQRRSADHWLLQVARKFNTKLLGAALTVMYDKFVFSLASLGEIGNIQQIAHLLEMHPTSLKVPNIINDHFDYRRKLHFLKIDVGMITSCSSMKKKVLYDLIAHLPTLKHLEFYHDLDMAPYRELDKAIKWTYPEEIFQALEYVDPEADATTAKTKPCYLERWRWSSRLAGETWSVMKLEELHKKPIFQHIKTMSFVNYQLPDLKEGEDDPGHEVALAAAIRALPELTHLVFEACSLLNSEMFPILDGKFQHLEIINCWEVTSDDLAPFLDGHGQHLLSLTLKHNPALNLSFLSVLKASCPKLQVLRVDLNIFHAHSTYKNADPLYDHLLLTDQVPQWPSSLQTIDIAPLRRISSEAAEIFFQSLADSAGELPLLRELKIELILDIPVRERAEFRSKWMPELPRIFQRPKSANPGDVLQSIERNIQGIPATTGLAAQDEDVDRLSENFKRSASIKATEYRVMRSRNASRAKPNYAEDDEEDREADDQYEPIEEEAVPPRNERENLRLRGLDRELISLERTAGVSTRKWWAASASTTPASIEEEDDVAKKPKVKGPQVIQGLCHTVTVSISNIRPTETKLTEADMLDVEQSGDEDWNGVDLEYDRD